MAPNFAVRSLSSVKVRVKDRGIIDRILLIMHFPRDILTTRCLWTKLETSGDECNPCATVCDHKCNEVTCAISYSSQKRLIGRFLTKHRLINQTLILEPDQATHSLSVMKSRF